MFSAILFTRTAFRWMMAKGALKKLTMANLAPKRQWNFLRYRHVAVFVSLVFILGSFVIFAKRGASNFGIDFRGGDLLVLSAEPALTVSEARQAVVPLGLSEITIQREQASNASMLSIRSAEDTSNKILSCLRKAFPANNIIAAQQDKVGAQSLHCAWSRNAWHFALCLFSLWIFFCDWSARGTFARCDYYRGSFFTFGRRAFARDGGCHFNNRWLFD
jgi:hypothetical protein